MATERIKNPARLVEVIAPGFEVAARTSARSPAQPDDAVMS